MDWTGAKYVGFTIDWDYNKCEVHLLMPEYVNHALMCFQHPSPRKPQQQWHPHVLPQYGQKQQFVEQEDSTQALTRKKTNSYKRSRLILILCAGHQQHLVNGPQHNHQWISKTNKKHTKESQTVFRVCYNKDQSHYHALSQWDYPSHP